VTGRNIVLGLLTTRMIFFPFAKCGKPVHLVQERATYDGGSVPLSFGILDREEAQPLFRDDGEAKTQETCGFSPDESLFLSEIAFSRISIQPSKASQGMNVLRAFRLAAVVWVPNPGLSSHYLLKFSSVSCQATLGLAQHCRWSLWPDLTRD
jgi:hypothetical protein